MAATVLCRRHLPIVVLTVVVIVFGCVWIANWRQGPKQTVAFVGRTGSKEQRRRRRCGACIPETERPQSLDDENTIVRAAQ